MVAWAILVTKLSCILLWCCDCFTVNGFWICCVTETTAFRFAGRRKAGYIWPSTPYNVRGNVVLVWFSTFGFFLLGSFWWGCKRDDSVLKWCCVSSMLLTVRFLNLNTEFLYYAYFPPSWIHVFSSLHRHRNRHHRDHIISLPLPSTPSHSIHLQALCFTDTVSFTSLSAWSFVFMAA